MLVFELFPAFLAIVCVVVGVGLWMAGRRTE
jgi:hypothetical protein